MTIISFFTKNTPYKEVFESTLKPSLMKFNLDYIVEEVPNLGSWQANTRFKPTYILKKLNELNDDIFWIDVDGEFLSAPDFSFLKNSDIGIYYLDWKVHYKNGNRKELVSSNVYFKNNDKIKKLIESWIELMPICNLEQEGLDKALQITKDIDICYLPSEYCCILDFDNKIPSYISNPVIIHHQASRKLRRHIR